MTAKLFDADAERALLGAAILDPRDVTEIEALPPEAFHDPSHRTIWTAMMLLVGRSFTVPALRAKMGAAATPAVVEALRAIESGALSSGGLPELAERVTDLWLRRKAHEAGRAIMAAAEDSDVPSRAVVETAEREVFALGDTAQVGEDPTPLAIVVQESLEQVERIRKSGSLSGVTTGLDMLDEQTSGMQAGELWLLAARPAVGKTAFVMQTILAAARRGVGSLVFSLEMPRTQLGIRLLAGEAHMDQAKLKGGVLSNWDQDKLAAAAKSLSLPPVWIDDSGKASIADVRAKARRLKRRFPKLGLIAVDYLQLVDAASRGESREQAVAGVSRGLKRLAKEMGMPVLALSQLSRKSEEAQRKPMLSDLRESGSLEQDADVVLFIHRDAKAEPQGAEGVIDCLVSVAKQRNGPVGEIDLKFISKQTRFEEACG